MYISLINPAIIIFWISFLLDPVLGNYLLAALSSNRDNLIIYNLLNFELVILGDYSGWPRFLNSLFANLRIFWILMRVRCISCRAVTKTTVGFADMRVK
jgi:hypothetical protein